MQPPRGYPMKTRPVCRHSPVHFSLPRALAAVCAAMFLLAAFPLHAGAKSADGELPLTVAIARALEADPRLRAAAARIIAAEGSLRQAGARPNPVLSVEAENFSGTGPLSGYSGAETSVTLSFEIEAGGQGEARVALAGREREQTELERILQGLDLIRDVEIAYAEALGADELRAIAIEQAKTAEAVRATVRRRVAAAREPLMAGVRADASAAEAQVNLSRTELQFQAAMMRLASYWGGGSGFSLTSASMQEPSADGLEPDAFSEQDSLDLLHLSLLRGRAAAATEVERTRAIPNPTVTFGWRRLEELDGDGAFMGGVSIPLPLFDDNEGAIARASAEENSVAYEVEAGRIDLMRTHADLTRQLAGEGQAVISYESIVIPQAERALALAQEGYGAGAFSYLDVLSAQAALADARMKRAEALRAWRIHRAELDRLTCRYASLIQGQEVTP